MALSKAPPKWLQTLLVDHSTSRYYIEYKRFLFNHMAHGMIALYNLGASPTRIERFIEFYKQRLEEPTKYEPSEETPIADVSSWVGNRRHFYALCTYYENLLDSDYKSLNEMVAAEFPKHSAGMIGQAVHGIIHLGYGLAAKSKKIICEGIAYMHGSYQAPKLSQNLDLTKLGAGKQSFLEVLDMVRLNKEFSAKAHAAGEKHRVEFNGSDYLIRLAGLFSLPSGGDDMMKHVYNIKFPEFYDAESRDLSQIKKLCDWIIDSAITVYAMTDRPNDFFLLHGVTGAWGLKQVLALIEDYDTALQSIETFMFVIITVYVLVNCPQLSVAIDTTTKSDEDAWQSVIAEVMAKDMDEHIYKLIHVCHERFKENPRDGHLYAFASNIAASKPLGFE